MVEKYEIIHNPPSNWLKRLNLGHMVAFIPNDTAYIKEINISKIIQIDIYPDFNLMYTELHYNAIDNEGFVCGYDNSTAEYVTDESAGRFLPVEGQMISEEEFLLKEIIG